MENRDSIVRKLNALKAKFANGSNCSEAEAETAMRMYDALMQKYNLTETDLSLKEGGISFVKMNAGVSDDLPPMAHMTTIIGLVTDTQGLWGGNYSFIVYCGTMADIQYAEFLHRLIEGSLESSWAAYRNTPQFNDLNAKKGVEESAIRNGFTKGFLMRMTAKLEDMMEKHIEAGTALMVLKQDLILAALDQAGLAAEEVKAVAKHGPADAMVAGGEEADKVRLRQEMDEGQTLLLEGG